LKLAEALRKCADAASISDKICFNCAWFCAGACATSGAGASMLAANT